MKRALTPNTTGSDKTLSAFCPPGNTAFARLPDVAGGFPFIEWWPNIIRESGLGIVPLDNGSISIVDRKDLWVTVGLEWRENKHERVSYAWTRVSNRPVYLHRLINNTPSNLDTDHIDHDGLNNRRSNLRSVTAKQNMENRRPKTKLKTHCLRGHARTPDNVWRGQYCITCKRARDLARYYARKNKGVTV